MNLMSVQFKDKSKEVLNKFKENKVKALTAVGQECVNITLDNMRNKYYKDIHLTGDLKRDVNFNVRASDQCVDIGNSLNYGIWVHEGTGRMKARPYLRDTASENTEKWKQIFIQYLGKNFRG